MKNRKLVSAAVFSCLAAAGYAAWLRIEEARAWRTAWAEVTDPIQEPTAEAESSQT
ncbi:Uncharacterised protein [Actinomyces bovis]|uniref:Uncharacterized protein n=1 Tax=Actinomyces bovis TaxID=1658 RepID=A0ABY1VRU9_9ACTO|nr:DLW-39 family protein [Actinomyces bovis]SPT54392.1 Uncharacterised protein [Actinomyces bovis]VEG56052.1 Uncharacterised protein [Actinomyces israelii]